MYKVLTWTAILFGIQASPFTGGHSDAKHILRDDGSSAHKLEPKKAKNNKYSHMVSRKLNINPNDSFMAKMRHSLFGKTESELKFEQAFDQIHMLSKVRAINLKKQLGQAQLNDGFSVLLENDGVLMWVGEVLMGPTFSPMNVVFDTGSDWLVV